MSDISIDIPWWLVVLTAPLFFPPATLLAAILCGILGYWAERSMAQAALAACAGALVFPCSFLLVWMGRDVDAPLLAIVVIPVLALGLLGGWLWRINRAGWRRRVGN